MDEYGRIHYRQIDLEPSEGKPEANDVAEERAYSGKTNAQPSFQHTAPMTYEPILHSDTWRDVVEKFEFGPLPGHEWPADVLIMAMVVKLKNITHLNAWKACLDLRAERDAIALFRREYARQHNLAKDTMSSNGST